MPPMWICGIASTLLRAYRSVMTEHRKMDYRARGLAVLRSRGAAPAESIEAATERRRTEYEAIMNPGAEAIAEAAQAIITAAAKARGEIENTTAPPQPVRRPPTADESTALAAQIIAAGRKARGEA
jgi:hypothetical protein